MKDNIKKQLETLNIEDLNLLLRNYTLTESLSDTNNVKEHEISLHFGYSDFEITFVGFSRSFNEPYFIKPNTSEYSFGIRLYNFSDDYECSDEVNFNEVLEYLYNTATKTDVLRGAIDCFYKKINDK